MPMSKMSEANSSSSKNVQENQTQRTVIYIYYSSVGSEQYQFRQPGDLCDSHFTDARLSRQLGLIFVEHCSYLSMVHRIFVAEQSILDRVIEKAKLQDKIPQLEDL